MATIIRKSNRTESELYVICIHRWGDWIDIHEDDIQLRYCMACNKKGRRIVILKHYTVIENEPSVFEEVI